MCLATEHKAFCNVINNFQQVSIDHNYISEHWLA